jgi:hypothetical protein
VAEGRPRSGTALNAVLFLDICSSPSLLPVVQLLVTFAP